jgi:RsiW-degrading membrane proteinase PrsW (M82 family)
VADLFLVLWAVIPPLLLLAYYNCRVYSAPSLLWLLLFLISGAVSGFLALSLEWVFETVANQIVEWRQVQRSLFGVASRQLVEIGPIEETCKLIAVIAPTCYLQRRYRLRPSSIFLFTIAVALGFTAQENWVYLFHGTASILDRSIGTPIHAMFSAPWGYALAINISSTTRLHQNSQSRKNSATTHIQSSLPHSLLPTPYSLINSVVCHALVNTLSSTGRYSPPLQLLSYGLFPFLVWMFWRLEQLLRKVQGKATITLISGYTPQHRYWQRGLVLFALMLGGNAIFGLFLLARILSPLSLPQLFDPDTLRFLFNNLLLNFTFGILAWVIYFYLWHSARRQYIQG